jgi:glycosyltransferase involved in cell wall biosynthesis
MKLLLTVPAFFPDSIGGGEVYVLRVAKELRARGHEAVVLTAGKGAAEVERYAYDGVPVVTFRPGSSSRRSEEYVQLGPELREAIARAIAEARPDLVHANGFKPAVTVVCRELGIPSVVTAHHAGIACANGTLMRPDGSVCVRPMSVRDCVPCVNRMRFPGLAGRLLSVLPRAAYRPIGRRLDAAPRQGYLGRGLVYPWLVERSVDAKRLVLDGAQIVVAPSSYMRELLVRNGRRPEGIAVIPHGIEPLARSPLAAFGNRPVRFGYVGRIDRLKGLHVLLEALEGLRDGGRCALHVFGAARTSWDEEYRATALARYRGNAGVSDHGPVPPGRLSEAFATFDVLVVPSLLPEAFGLVVLEAFSAGRPVIVFDSGALPELVRDGVDGWIVRGNDAALLRATLQACVDEPARIEVAARAIPQVRDMRQHVDELLALYGRVIGHG